MKGGVNERIHNTIAGSTYRKAKSSIYRLHESNTMANLILVVDLVVDLSVCEPTSAKSRSRSQRLVALERVSPTPSYCSVGLLPFDLTEDARTTTPTTQRTESRAVWDKS